MGKSASPSPSARGTPTVRLRPAQRPRLRIGRVGTHAGRRDLSRLRRSQHADDRRAAGPVSAGNHGPVDRAPHRPRLRAWARSPARHSVSSARRASGTRHFCLMHRSIRTLPRSPARSRLHQREPGEPHGALDQHDFVQHADLHGPCEPAECPGDHQLRQHPSPGRDGGGAGSRRRPTGGWDRRGDDDLPGLDRHSVGDVADEPVLASAYVRVGHRRHGRNSGRRHV